MHKEMKSLHDNKTWELVDLPKDKQIVDSKWVYKKKDGATEQEGKIFKARLVAKGFTQRKGVDYFDGQYTKKVLAKFNMASAKAVSTPLAPYFKLFVAFCPTDSMEKGLMSKVPYDSAVGSLMYLMVYTRPDISHVVGLVSRYMANLGKVHWEAVKWILRYLKGTSDVGLLFDAQEDSARLIIGYVDFDYEGDLDHRKSTSGYTFPLAGGCVSWRSTKQRCISQSSTEVEYVAATKATKEAIWLNKLVRDLGILQSSLDLHCDSNSALHIAANRMTHGRVKHIDIRYHFIRQAVSDKQIELIKIEGKLNPADMLTKVIPLESFSRHCVKLQILHM
ncbi:unnamed protein product [Calypogeia fissa]